MVPAATWFAIPEVIVTTATGITPDRHGQRVPFRIAYNL